MKNGTGYALILDHNAMTIMSNDAAHFSTVMNPLNIFAAVLIRPMFRTRARRAPAISSLELAISRARADTIKSLIEHGEDINAINTRGHAPIHLATTKGNSDVVQLLLENGADVNVAGTESGCTSLHYAASLGYVDLCELLVRYGACTDAQTARLETPLHLAITNGHSEVVALLLKYQASLNIRDENDMTPLQLAENLSHRSSNTSPSYGHTC